MFGFQLSVILLLRIPAAHLYKVSTLEIVGMAVCEADCVKTHLFTFDIKQNYLLKYRDFKFHLNESK